MIALHSRARSQRGEKWAATYDNEGCKEACNAVSKRTRSVRKRVITKVREDKPTRILSHSECTSDGMNSPFPALR